MGICSPLNTDMNSSYTGRGPNYLRASLHSFDWECFLPYLLPRFQRRSMGSQSYWVPRLILTTQQPHSFAYLGSKTLVVLCCLQWLISCRSELEWEAPATLIPGGKVMGTGDLCANFVPPTLLFLAHVPISVNHMPNGPAERWYCMTALEDGVVINTSDQVSNWWSNSLENILKEKIGVSLFHITSSDEWIPCNMVEQVQSMLAWSLHHERKNVSDRDVGGVPQVTGYKSSLISRDSCGCQRNVSARDAL